MTGRTSTPPRPLSACEQPLTDAYDVALLDLDGVVYIGPDAVPGAPEQLRRATEAGMRIGYITNNASRTPDAVAEHLRSFGLPARTEDVVTSAQAVSRLIAGEFPPGSPVLVVGGEGLRQGLEEAGLVLVDSADDKPVAVVQGFAPDVTWTRIAEGAHAINAGAKWFASNLDLTLPTARGRAPGNGALVRALRFAVDVDPVVAGKPEPPLLLTSIERLRAQRPLMVGDRLDTDIAGAYNVGIPSLWVATGVNTAADLVVAPVEQRPTYLAAGLSALAEPQPGVETSNGVHSCRGWRATVVGGVVRLAGEGERYDGLRALLAATWLAADAGDPPDATEALAMVGMPSRDTVAGNARDTPRRT
jgi:glycerol 3-phosphatase-2